MRTVVAVTPSAAVLGLAADAVLVEPLVEWSPSRMNSDGGRGFGVAAGPAELLHSRHETFDLAGDGGVFAGGNHVADFDGHAGFEAVHDLLQFAEVERAVEDGDNGALDELSR
jgi:hypothetical protein